MDAAQNPVIVRRFNGSIDTKFYVEQCRVRRGEKVHRILQKLAAAMPRQKRR